MRVSLHKYKTMPTHSIGFEQWSFLLCCSRKLSAWVQGLETVALINHTSDFHSCVQSNFFLYHILIDSMPKRACARLQIDNT